MPTYSPGEVADKTGFSLDTLRYYERIGLLDDIARTAGGQRVFTDDDVSWLGILRCLRDTGMPITLMRRYGRLCQDESTLPDRIALIDEHARSVAAQIAELQVQQDRLASKAEWYRGELARRAARAS